MSHYTCKQCGQRYDECDCDSQKTTISPALQQVAENSQFILWSNYCDKKMQVEMHEFYWEELDKLIEELPLLNTTGQAIIEKIQNIIYKAQQINNKETKHG